MRGSSSRSVEHLSAREGMQVQILPCSTKPEHLSYNHGKNITCVESAKPELIDVLVIFFMLGILFWCLVFQRDFGEYI